eukprot:2038523-Ditylum_brightwellii.AAC.1
MAFWRELLKCMKDMQYMRNSADLCMYYKWTLAGLVIWLSWINDCMVWGPKSVVPAESKAFTNQFECDDVGEVNEYVGCKIERDKKDKSFIFTQPILIQSFNDEFELSNKHPKTPAEAGTTLVKTDAGGKVGSK